LWLSQSFFYCIIWPTGKAALQDGNAFLVKRSGNLECLAIVYIKKREIKELVQHLFVLPTDAFKTTVADATSVIAASKSKAAIASSAAFASRYASACSII
jgi:hypothetical protein